MNTTIEEKKLRLGMVNELRESPAFRVILLPHFRALARHHAEQCRNKGLSWEKRAEHIEAAEMAEQLASYLDERAVALQSQIEAMADSRGK